MALEKRVIIAAGHGGGDSGAVAQGTTEANETIDITNRVVAKLRNDGQVSVVQVPNELGLVDTINWINARYKGLENGVSVEVHKNSGGGNGSEVWTPSYPDGDSINMAQKVTNAIAAATGEPNRGVKQAQNNRWGRLGFCDDTNTYAMLIEAGFIDVNPVGGAANERYAEGIFRGLLAIWGLSPKVTPPPVVVPVSKPVPAAEKLPEPILFTTNLEPTSVWDLTSNPNWKAVTAINKGKEFRAFATIRFNGSIYYVAEHSFTKGLKNGVNAVDLTRKPDVPKTPEPPVVTPPVVVPPVVVPPSKDDEQDKRLSTIEALLNKVVEFLQSLFVGFKK